jgi:HEAT repeat protein
MLCLTLLAGLFILVSPLRFVAVGIIHGEHFYRHWPTSYWRSQVRGWAEQGIIADQGFDGVKPAILQGEPEATPVLLDLLKDPSAKVRLEAADALLHGRCDDPEIATALMAPLGDTDHELQDRAQRLLCLVGPAGRETAVPLLIARLGDQDVYRRIRVATVLIDLNRHDPAIVEALLDIVLTAGHESPGADAARQLARLGPVAKAALPRLREIRRKYTSDDIVSAIERALFEISPPLQKKAVPEK